MKLMYPTPLRALLGIVTIAHMPADTNRGAMSLPQPAFAPADTAMTMGGASLADPMRGLTKAPAEVGGSGRVHSKGDLIEHGLEVGAVDGSDFGAMDVDEANDDGHSQQRA